MGCGVIATIQHTKTIIRHNEHNFSNKQVQAITSRASLSTPIEKRQVHFINAIQ